jgi:hypothetical protein
LESRNNERGLRRSTLRPTLGIINPLNYAREHFPADEGLDKNLKPWALLASLPPLDLPGENTAGALLEMRGAGW